MRDWWKVFIVAVFPSAHCCVSWSVVLLPCVFHIRQTYVSVFRNDAVVRSGYVAMETREVTLAFLFVGLQLPLELFFSIWALHSSDSNKKVKCLDLRDIHVHCQCPMTPQPVKTSTNQPKLAKTLTIHRHLVDTQIKSTTSILFTPVLQNCFF